MRLVKILSTVRKYGISGQKTCQKTKRVKALEHLSLRSLRSWIAALQSHKPGLLGSENLVPRVRVNPCLAELNHNLKYKYTMRSQIIEASITIVREKVI